MVPETDVLIAGAGPVGLTMAAELVRYGLRIRIVEQAAQRTDKSKALVLWSRTLELLAAGGYAAPFIEAGLKMLATNIVAGRQTIAHIGFSGLDSPYPYALMLPQSETERLLEAHLQSLGVTVERQVTLTAFTETGSGVTASLRHADGTTESCAAAWLVGCDGAHSTVRHGLGLNFSGSTIQTDWLLADLHLAGLQFPANEMVVFLHHEGVLVLFPISPGRYRVIADHGPAAGLHPPTPDLPAVQAVIDRRGPPGIVASSPLWLSGFRINERKIKDYRAGRIFLAGDAAHVHSPAGGQGMNTGMQDAFNLAWKLALVQKQICNAALLDSYSPERSAIGDQVLANAGRMTAVGVAKRPILQRLRNTAAKLLLRTGPVRHVITATLAELNLRYRHSPLNGPAAAGLRPTPGERLRPERAPPITGTPLFTLAAAVDEATAHLLAAYPELLAPSLSRPPRPGGLWLLRPDGYVAATAKAGDTQPIATYLDNLRQR